MTVVNNHNELFWFDKNKKICRVEVRNIDKLKIKFPKSAKFIIANAHLTPANRVKVADMIGERACVTTRFPQTDPSMPKLQIKVAIDWVEHHMTQVVEIKALNKTDLAILEKLIKKYNNKSISIAAAAINKKIKSDNKTK